MNTISNGSHPTMWKCVEILQKEELHWHLEIEKLRCGKHESQAKSQRQLDIRLQNIVNSYNSAQETLDYLRSIGKCLHDYSES